jgi:hypothetical protein
MTWEETAEDFVNLQKHILERAGLTNLEALIEEQNRARQEETFVQAVVRNMFPRPLQPYGNALWLIGRALKMRQDGVLR